MNLRTAVTNGPTRSLVLGVVASAIAIAVVACVPPSAPINANPSFETACGSAPCGWTGEGATLLRLADSQAPNGSYVAEVDRATSVPNPLFPGISWFGGCETASHVSDGVTPYTASAAFAASPQTYRQGYGTVAYAAIGVTDSYGTTYLLESPATGPLNGAFQTVAATGIAPAGDSVRICLMAAEPGPLDLATNQLLADNATLRPGTPGIGNNIGNGLSP